MVVVVGSGVWLVVVVDGGGQVVCFLSRASKPLWSAHVSDTIHFAARKDSVNAVNTMLCSCIRYNAYCD